MIAKKLFSTSRFFYIICGLGDNCNTCHENFYARHPLRNGSNLSEGLFFCLLCLKMERFRRFLTEKRKGRIGFVVNFMVKTAARKMEEKANGKARGKHQEADRREMGRAI